MLRRVCLAHLYYEEAVSTASREALLRTLMFFWADTANKGMYYFRDNRGGRAIRQSTI